MKRTILPIALVAVAVISWVMPATADDSLVEGVTRGVLDEIARQHGYGMTREQWEAYQARRLGDPRKWSRDWKGGSPGYGPGYGPGPNRGYGPGPGGRGAGPGRGRGYGPPGAAPYAPYPWSYRR